MKSLRKALLSVLLYGVAISSAWPAPRVTYVGLGRYSCSGSTAECAQTNSNNELSEESNRRRYQDEQDRAQRYFEDSRRREQETKRDRQRD